MDVAVPFTVRPDLVRSERALGSHSALQTERLAAKRDAFSGPFGLDYLGQLSAAADGLDLLATELQLPVGSFESLALGIEEDLALLHNGVLQAIAFAFPSGFVPTKKLGLDFAGMHLPVADGDALRSASAGITAAIKRPGARYERGVWTLTTLPSLSQHPGILRPEPASLHDLFFRTERQVLVGLGEGWTGFTVAVEMTPWTGLSPSQQQRIAAGVQSMSPATLSYKGLHTIAQLFEAFR